MKISGWPFLINLDGDLEYGHPAFLQVEFSASLTEEDFAVLNYVVDSFVALGAIGGLGGDRVSPLKSTVIASGDPHGGFGSTRVRWDFRVIAIDGRALVVLFNALSFLVRGIVRVVVEAQVRSGNLPISADALPPPWPQMPFDDNDDRTGPGVELRITFVEPLTAQAREAVENALQTWLDCGSIQGYRDWETRPDASLLAPCDDPAFIFDDDEVTAMLEDSGVLEGAYDILLNLLIRMNASVRIKSVDLM